MLIFIFKRNDECLGPFWLTSTFYGFLNKLDHLTAWNRFVQCNKTQHLSYSILLVSS
jgi:hypothetical protein